MEIDLEPRKSYRLSIDWSNIDLDKILKLFAKVRTRNGSAGCVTWEKFSSITITIAYMLFSIPSLLVLIYHNHG